MSWDKSAALKSYMVRKIVYVKSYMVRKIVYVSAK